MKKACFIITSTLMMAFIANISLMGQDAFQRDTIETQMGPLVITFIGHSTLQFTWQDQQIYVDPVAQMADFVKFPKADLILITHDHGDHFDKVTVNNLLKPETIIILTEACYDDFRNGIVMKNGSFQSFKGIDIEAVPAYNIIQRRGNGKPYHEKGVGNGYMVTFGATRVYIAGDTEYIPEMKDFGKIDIAFLPVAEPYTMTIPMVDLAARTLLPTILYPYHLNKTDPDAIVKVLLDSGIDIRIRALR